MNFTLAMKLGQILGACLMIASVAACQMKHIEYSPGLLALGLVIYGGCRISAWLKSPKP